MFISFLEKRKVEHYHNSVTNNNSFTISFLPRSAYGRGVYFARDTSFSVRYTGGAGIGAHYVYLARVLVGKYCLGSISMEPRWSTLLAISSRYPDYRSCLLYTYIFLRLKKDTIWILYPLLRFCFFFFSNLLNFYHVTCLLVTRSVTAGYSSLCYSV